MFPVTTIWGELKNTKNHATHACFVANLNALNGHKGRFKEGFLKSEATQTNLRKRPGVCLLV